MLTLHSERMNDAFEKQHIVGLPFDAALHCFTAPDYADPHDHPFAFTSHVLSGGYVEEVFTIADGKWTSDLIERLPGTSHHVPATHIHRIVSLPQGTCWTLVKAGPHERTTRFWRFGDAIESRAWNERDWVRYEGEA